MSPALPHRWSYRVAGTPVGRLLVAAGEDQALLACQFVADELAERVVVRRLCATLGAPSGAGVPTAWAAVASYLEGGCSRVAGPVDLTLLSAFQRQVLPTVAELAGPRQTTTYARVAAAVGAPRAARAVGSALRSNPLCLVLPCHRVLPATGNLGGYAGGPAAKQYLLDLERSAPG